MTTDKDRKAGELGNEDDVEKDKFDTDRGPDYQKMHDKSTEENEATGYGVKKKKRDEKTKGEGLEEFINDKPESQTGDKDDE